MNPGVHNNSRLVWKVVLGFFAAIVACALILVLAFSTGQKEKTCRKKTSPPTLIIDTIPAAIIPREDCG